MTKKHFELFAVAIALIEDEDTRLTVRDVVEDVCWQSNPRFDRRTFRNAIDDLRKAERPSGFGVATFNEWFGRLSARADARGPQAVSA